MNLGQVRLQRINWRREAIFPTQALAETCLVAPWLTAFLFPGDSARPEHIAGVCLAVILGTLYLARTMDALRISVWIQRVIVLLEIFSLIGIALRVLVFSQPQWAGLPWPETLTRSSTWIILLPGAVLLALGVTWLCWRGLRLAYRPVSVRDAALGFQLGVIVLAMLPLTRATRSVMLFVPAFFFSQLLALGLARIESVSQQNVGRRLPSSGWWLAALTGSTGLLIVVGGAVSAAVQGIGPAKLLTWLGPVIGIIALPLLVLLTPLIALLVLVLQAFKNPILAVFDVILAFINQIRQWINSITPQNPPPQLSVLLRLAGISFGALVVAGVLIVLLAVVWLVGKWRSSRASGEDELRESTWSSQALLRKLRRQLRQRLARLRNLADIVGRFGAGGLFTALTIRRIYAQTVQLAASRGYPRPAAHTPYEHLATLNQAFPGCSADLIQITEAYVGVHYGELPEQPEALAEIRAAYERIKTSERQSDVVPGHPVTD